MHFTLHASSGSRPSGARVKSSPLVSNISHLQRSKSWAERASKGCGFALTNIKKKSNDSAEPVTFTLNFR